MRSSNSKPVPGRENRDYWENNKKLLTDKYRELRLNHKQKQDHNNSKIHDQHQHGQIKIIVFMMAIIASISACIVIMYSNLIKEVKSVQEATIIEYKNEQFEGLWGVINEKISYSAKNNIMNASEDIEESIREMDLGTLKQELDNGVYSDELMSIFEENLQHLTLNGISNGRNNAMIISNDYIILNYSYYAYPNNAADTHSFSDIITSGYNTELGQNAVDHIYKQDNAVICIELEASDNPDHIMITDSTKESFRQVYLNEGLEGFKNYQFLVPVYITETGDIFGQSDIVHGERQDKTHKFIIIQEFNLYDQIAIYPEYFDTNVVGEIRVQQDKIINNMYLLGLIFVILTITILFNFISIYNNFIYGYMLALNGDSEDEKDENKTKE